MDGIARQQKRLITDEAALNSFVQAFERATSLRVRESRLGVPFDSSVSSHRELDALVILEAEPPLTLAVEVMRQGYPQKVSAALWQLEEYRRSAPAAIPLIIGDISSGSRALLRERGVGYYDFDGSLFFRHDHILVNIERPPHPRHRSEPSSLFTEAREKVVHALLQSAGEWTTGSEIAQRAGVSAYTASTTIRELQLRDWLAAEGGGRTSRCRVQRAGELLDAWAEAWQGRKEVRSRYFLFAASGSLVQEITRKMLQSSPAGKWTLTGTAAGNVIAPLLTNVDHVDLIVSAGTAQGWAKNAGLSPAEKGANVTMWERDGASELFQQDIGETRVASPWIVYLDLVRDQRGRNKELAAHLREQVLRV
jgi:hypothetical protein